MLCRLSRYNYIIPRHGEVYQQKGEQQLADYLDKLHVDKGYLISFNFNKNKEVGRMKKIINGKQIIEFMV